MQQQFEHFEQSFFSALVVGGHDPLVEKRNFSCSENARVSSQPCFAIDQETVFPNEVFPDEALPGEVLPIEVFLCAAASISTCSSLFPYISFSPANL